MKLKIINGLKRRQINKDSSFNWYKPKEILFRVSTKSIILATELRYQATSLSVWDSVYNKWYYDINLDMNRKRQSAFVLLLTLFTNYTSTSVGIAATIINFNWTYVIAIHSDDAYGTGGIAALRKELHSFNSSSRVCLATVIPVTDSATSKDFSDIVDRINREWVANSSIVVLFGHLSEAEGIFEAILQKQEMDSKFVERNITWIGSDSWGDNVPPRYNKIAQGLMSTIPQVHLSEIFDDYFLSLHPTKNNTRNPWFNEYWEEIFNCSLGGRKDAKPCDLDNQAQSREKGYRQNSLLSFVVDAVYAFAHAIRNIQKDNCTGSEEGLCPKILETQLKGRVVRGDLLRRYLHNISFEGTSADG